MPNNKITYRLIGDYLIPNLELPSEEKEVHIGIWGMRRKNYLMQNNHLLFSIMLSDGTLWKHLAEIDKEAEGMFSRLVDEMAQADGVTEDIKATNQPAWVGAMNDIWQRATEIVKNELVYT